MSAPKVGTRVSLYIPGWDEQEAMAIHCVRTNGDSCERMSDPSRRSFVSEHGKELNLYPEEMSLVGAQGLVGLSDENGIVIQSRKPVVIVGQSVTFEAPVVDIQAPAGEVVMAQGQPGGSQASLMMSSRYDLLAMAHTQAEGRKQVVHSPPIDIPQPGKFDLGGLVGNVLAGLTVVAAVGVTLATFGAAGPVVLGAMAMGSMAVIGQGVSDVVSGQVSSQEAYMSVGFWSAVAGAVSGMVGSSVGKFLTSKLNMLTPMAVNGLSGMVETVAENAVLGVKTNLSDLGLAFAASTALPVIGYDIALGVKHLTGQADNRIRSIRGVDGKVNHALVPTAQQTGAMLSKIPTPVQSKSGRNFDGVVTGSGNGNVSRMMRGTQGNIGLIPQEIANKLSGRSFNSFDDFRSAFWKEVANSSYASEFSTKNITRMSKGLAPKVVKSQQYGRLSSYILHHKTPIHAGGGVYDLNNLVIVTPIMHQEILDKAYHFGK